MKDRLTSLETSKKLQEAGIEGRCEFYWSYSFAGGWDIVDTWNANAIPAYLLSELLEMVGCVYSLSAGGITLLLGHKGQQYRDQTFYGNPIQAVSEAILWQKE